MLTIKKNQLFTNSGYSLVEIVVVIAVIGAMGMGTTSLLSNMLKISQKNAMKIGLATFQNNIEELLLNEDAWTNTYKNNGTLNCLWEGDNIPCANNTSVLNISVYERFPAPLAADPPPGPVVPIFYDGATATTGFQVNGTPCNTFNAGAGDDDCPLRYDISVTLSCPASEASCLQPAARIVGVLQVNPATDLSYANRIDPTEYAFEIEKNNEIRFEPLEVKFVSTVGGTAGGGGSCAPTGTANPRPFNQESHDIGDNVTLGGNQFTLRAGFYDCEVMASGFEASNGFIITLSAGGTIHPIGSGYSGPGSSATVIGNVNLDLAVDTVVQVLHQCATSHPTEPEYDMGIPAPTGYNAGPGTEDYSAGNTFTRVTCTRRK